MMSSADGSLLDHTIHLLHLREHKFSFKPTRMHTVALLFNNIQKARKVK